MIVFRIASMVAALSVAGPTEPPVTADEDEPAVAEPVDDEVLDPEATVVDEPSEPEPEPEAVEPRPPGVPAERKRKRRSVPSEGPPIGEEGTSPGGYWAAGERPEVAPPDGHEKIVIGSILVPLGTVGAISGGITAYFTAPDHCQERLKNVDLSRDECRGIYIFSLVRVGYGSLMAISGAVILAIGLKQRQKYRAWKLERGKVVIAPMPLLHRRRVTGGGLGFQMRF